jgi:hypothetical protein
MLQEILASEQMSSLVLVGPHRSSRNCRPTRDSHSLGEVNTIVAV